MYKAFLETDLPEDIELTFERLMRASESHLKAFERNSGEKVGLGNSNIQKGRFNSQKGSRNNSSSGIRGNFNR